MSAQPQPESQYTHPMFWPKYLRNDLAIDHASVFFNSFFGEGKEYKVVAVVSLVPRFKDACQKSIEAQTEQEVIDGVIAYLKSL